MKIYEIVIQEGKLISEQSHYILAENFVDAFKAAGKMLTKAQAECEDACIESISEQFKLEVVI